MQTTQQSCDFNLIYTRQINKFIQTVQDEKKRVQGKCEEITRTRNTEGTGRKGKN